MPQAAVQPTILRRADYFNSLANHAQRAKPGDSLAVATMDFDPSDPLVRNFLHQAMAAAQRGVQVYCLIDAYSLMLTKHFTPGPLLYATSSDAPAGPIHRRLLKTLDALRAAGIHVAILNKPAGAWNNPFAGRSHIKFAVHNRTAWLGGCNLTDHRQVDLMAQFDHGKTAAYFLDLARRAVATDQPLMHQLIGGRDYTIQISNDYRLLIDAGTPHQSIIYDQALQLIAQAKSYVVITCQLFPNGKTADYLKAAQARGLAVSIIFNHPFKHPFPFNIIHPAVTAYEELGSPRHFFDHQLPLFHPYIHAKALLTDAGSIIGSHNFLPSGVAFGTAEAALFTRRSDFAHQVYDCLQTSVRKPLPSLPVPS